MNVECICRECEWRGVVPAVAKCPACGGSYLRRPDALEAHADALAYALKIAAARTDGIADALTKSGFPDTASGVRVVAVEARDAVKVYEAAKAQRN